MAPDFEGRHSEWNEGSFKSMRLHEIQEKINYLKSNSEGVTTGEFNYILWFKQVESLAGEGYSKYSNTEREKIDKIRTLISDTIDFEPPMTFSKGSGLQGGSKGLLVDKKRFKMLRELIFKFELIVKDYNDAHGLTTQNRMDSSGDPYNG